MATRKSSKKTAHKSSRKVAVRSAAASQEMSYDAKTIITLLCLIFFYPIGLIFMWIWMNWPKWVKAIITIPLIVSILCAFIIAGLIGKAVKENVVQRQWQLQYQQQVPQASPSGATFQ